MYFRNMRSIVVALCMPLLLSVLYLTSKLKGIIKKIHFFLLFVQKEMGYSTINQKSISFRCLKTSAVSVELPQRAVGATNLRTLFAVTSLTFFNKNYYEI